MLALCFMLLYKWPWACYIAGWTVGIFVGIVDINTRFGAAGQYWLFFNWKQHLVALAAIQFFVLIAVVYRVKWGRGVFEQAVKKKSIAVLKPTDRA